MSSSSPLKIVIFFGSVREGRLGFRVAKYIESLLIAKKYDVHLFDPEKMHFPLLKKSLSMYNNESDAPKWLQDSHSIVKSADAYVVVSAEYNHSIPPALSNMMDYFPIPSYRHKPCSIITYSYGPYGGVRAAMQLRSFLGELGMVTPQFIYAVSSVHEAYSESGEPLDERQVSGARKSIQELEWFATALRNHRKAHGIPT